MYVGMNACMSVCLSVCVGLSMNEINEWRNYVLQFAPQMLGALIFLN